MTTLSRNQPPPPDDWKCSPGGHPLCQVCEKPLTRKWLKDAHLGPCCMECAQAPLLHQIHIRKSPTISLKTHG